MRDYDEVFQDEMLEYMEYLRELKMINQNTNSNKDHCSKRNMDQLKFWKNGDPDRNYCFLYSRPIQGNDAWVCTLTVHDRYKSYSYTGITSLFVKTKMNTKHKARDMAISLFSSDIERTRSFPPPRSQKQIDKDLLDKPLFPRREDEKEDHGVDDVTIFMRSSPKERAFKKRLDRELEEYWAKRPEDLYKTDSETENLTEGFTILEIKS